MRHVAVVADTFAIVEDNIVIGVVAKCNETQWAFYPLMKGSYHGVSANVSLQWALQAGLDWKIDQ